MDPSISIPAKVPKEPGPFPSLFLYPSIHTMYSLSVVPLVPTSETAALTKPDGVSAVVAVFASFLVLGKDEEAKKEKNLEPNFSFLRTAQGDHHLPPYIGHHPLCLAPRWF